MLVLNRPGKYWEEDQVTCGMFIVDITGDLSLFTENYWPSGGSRENTSDICLTAYVFIIIRFHWFTEVFLSHWKFSYKQEFLGLVLGISLRIESNGQQWRWINMKICWYTNISEIWFNIYSAFIFLIISQHHNSYDRWS